MSGLLSYTGLVRVYWNRHGTDLKWCLASPPPHDASPHAVRWELAVSTIDIRGASLSTRYEPKPTDDHDDGRPSAWLEGFATVEVLGGVAILSAFNPQEMQR